MRTRDGEHGLTRSVSPITPSVELIALRVLSTSVRCVEISGSADASSPVTYRRAAPGVIPGQRLTVAVTRRWSFRRTAMIGGDMLQASFSLRGLWQAGLERPQATATCLLCPACGTTPDARLTESVECLDRGDWLAARCLLLDILEDQPGCLVAHSTLGTILVDVLRFELAFAHFTAAIRLGMGALTREGCLPLQATRPVESSLLRALVGRGRLLAEKACHAAAEVDLQRALAWDPTDACGARGLLALLGSEGKAPNAP